MVTIFHFMNKEIVKVEATIPETNKVLTAFITSWAHFNL